SPLPAWGGAHSTNPSHKAHNYIRRVAEAGRGAGLGGRPQLPYGAASGRFLLSLTDRGGQAVSALHPNGTIGRPATDREDLSANFNEAESGAYAAMVRLAPGQWIVQLHSDELSRAGDPVFRLKQRVFVPEAP